MQLLLSVIICTYNPQSDYIRRVLQALQEQTLPIDLWELILIDNASDKLLSSEIDLSWHPLARHVREDELGLTPARLRGIQEATAETLIFVDDDNILDADYLESALKISKDWTMLGVWGGSVKPEFEISPPDWTKPYWWMLALRELQRDQWSNLLLPYETAPVGAGMCVRKVVAKKYTELVINNSKRLSLDAKGKKLLRSGDMDMAFTSCDVGLGTGVFVALKLTHLIPANRLEENYLLKLAEGIAYSNTLLEYFRGKASTLPRFSGLIKVLKYIYYNFVLKDSRTWRFNSAFAKGKALAIQELINGI
jgi:glycosyltransferase involved in cell wall biosynthesis